MSMFETIRKSAEQFAFEPKIENENNLKKFSKYIIVGMGGSHLAGNLLKTIKPELNIIIHSNYSLPAMSPSDLKERLVILSSYSGNTEETLDAYEEAGKLGLGRAVISIGGKLLEKAKNDKVPYIEMPNLNIEPRSALGLSLKSMSKFVDEKILEELTKLKDTFHPEKFEETGKDLAEKLYGYVPIIYSSEKNQPLTYVWKIKFNETAKIPAFFNVIPELNHNEMNAYDVRDSTRELSQKFYFIFLEDVNDHKKTQQRMKITAKLYQDRNFPTLEIPISGENIFHKIFESITVADFASCFIAEKYGTNPDGVPMVEEFKKLIEQ